MRVLVAGATGAVGTQLVPLLVAAGHQVTGTTTRPDRQDRIRAMGAEAAVVDGLDAVGVGETVARAAPEVVVHEMTALAGMSDLRHFDKTFAVTNKLRTEGIDHLLAAAKAADVRRVIVQSYAGWPTVPSGRALTVEGDPYEPNPPAHQRESLAAMRYLDNAVTGAPLEGLVLRYGGLYGPGASDDILGMIRKRRLPVIGSGAGVWSFLHVADAASATAAAVLRGAPGIYNVCDDDPAPVREWLPEVARLAGAPAPMRLPVWLGRLAGGDVAVRMMTRIQGASNAKARRELDWEPAYPSWRDGFRADLAAAARG